MIDLEDIIDEINITHEAIVIGIVMGITISSAIAFLLLQGD